MAASKGVDAGGDEALMKRILATHEHLYVKKFDPNPLLHAIKDVIQRASGSPSVEGYASAFKGDLLDNLKHLPYMAIKSVSCECSGASTTSEVAIGLLQSLGSYSWEAKAVITLAAFAANYGSYFSVSQFHGSNDPFSKSMAFLQLSPYLLKQPLKLKLETLKVVEDILDLANYIVEISQMFASSFAIREEDLAKAVYLSIQSTVACASMLMNTVALGNEYEPTVEEAQELSNLKMEINKMESWKKRIEEERILTGDYEKLDSLFKHKHTDNITILQALLCSTWIYNCSTKTQEELNKLSGKYVLLYFSYIEHLSKEEISILSEKYERKLTSYEIVWVPIVDVSTSWNNKEIEKYKKIRDLMRWYTTNDPWNLNKAVIKYIKKWKFEGESEFVVLNPQGEFVISGAINLISFLEKLDFKVDYNDNRWKGKMIQLLQDTMESIVNDWISAGKYIFLIGGDDIKWIQNFVNDAQGVAEVAKDAEDAKIGFVMMYAGKSNLNWATYQDIYKQFKETNKSTIPVSGFGDQNNMSSFWATLRSIWLTEIKTGKMDNMATLWTFDASGGGWAAICHGKSPEMAKARGETIPDILRKYREWEALAKRDGFLNALVQKIQEDKTPKDHHDCYNLQVAATTESTPKKMKCSLCDSAMKTFITYRCCGDH